MRDGTPVFKKTVRQDTRRPSHGQRPTCERGIDIGYAARISEADLARLLYAPPSSTPSPPAYCTQPPSTAPPAYYTQPPSSTPAPPAHTSLFGRRMRPWQGSHRDRKKSDAQKERAHTKRTSRAMPRLTMKGHRSFGWPAPRAHK